MSATFTEIITLTKLNCGSCSIVFAIPEERLKKLKDTGELFYCPNGCRIGYTQSTVNRLEDELAAKRTELTAAKCEAMRERQLRERAENEKRELERKARRVNKRSLAAMDELLQEWGLK